MTKFIWFIDRTNSVLTFILQTCQCEHLAISGFVILWWKSDTILLYAHLHKPAWTDSAGSPPVLLRGALSLQTSCIKPWTTWSHRQRSPPSADAVEAFPFLLQPGMLLPVKIKRNLFDTCHESTTRFYCFKSNHSRFKAHQTTTAKGYFFMFELILIITSAWHFSMDLFPVILS